MIRHKITGALSIMLLLSACATKQQRCIQANAGDYLRVTIQIDEKEANLARGYAVHEDVKAVTVPADCYTQAGKRYQCVDTNYQTVETPVAIDVAHERDRLKLLREQEKRLYPAAKRAVEECKRQYP